MDRSFLSRPEVISASRSFVCVRLLTYEDGDEAKLLRRLFTGWSGNLENSTFALLSPEGRPVIAAHRSPANLFRDADALIRTMNEVAAAYQPHQPAGGRPLPLVRDVRLAINVGACDRRPVAVITAPAGEARKKLEDRLRPLAWNDEFLGALVYAVATESGEVHHLYGLQSESGLAVVHPEDFGRWGKVAVQLPVDASADTIAEAFRAAIASMPVRATRNYEHIRAGRELGVFWETKIPVTDPDEQKVRDQTRRTKPKS